MLSYTVVPENAETFSPDNAGSFVYRNIYGQEDKITGIMLGANEYPGHFTSAYGTHLVLCTDMNVRPIIAPFKFQPVMLDKDLMAKMQIVAKWFIRCHAKYANVRLKASDLNSDRVLYNPSHCEGIISSLMYSWLGYVDGLARRTGWVNHCESLNFSNCKFPFIVFDMPLKRVDAKFTYLFNPAEMGLSPAIDTNGDIGIAKGTPGKMRYLSKEYERIVEKLLPNVHNVETVAVGTKTSPVNIEITLNKKPFGFQGRAFALTLRVEFQVCNQGAFIDTSDLVCEFIPKIMSTYAFSPIALETTNLRGEPVFATKAVCLMLSADWQRSFKAALGQPMSQALRFRIMNSFNAAKQLSLD